MTSKWQNVYNNPKNILSINDVQIDLIEEYNDGDTVPNEYTILTYNIWGLSIDDNLKKLFSLRKDMLISTILQANSDFVCLQEMSDYSYNELTDVIQQYKYASEKPYIKQISRKRNADIFFMSRFKPSKITIYGLPGILCYFNSMIVVEYINLVIINVYLQSGTKKSPGQANSWKQFSECRSILLQFIYDITKTFDNKNIVLCGDFNFHLDGTVQEWPEINIINKFKLDGFIDTYKYVNPDNDGFTEDTDRNSLRWNLKLIDKKYKFDAIFYKSINQRNNNHSSTLVGFDTSYLNPENSIWFINKMSDACGDFDKLKNVIKINNDYLIPINASDHFGVLTTIRN